METLNIEATKWFLRNVHLIVLATVELVCLAKPDMAEVSLSVINPFITNMLNKFLKVSYIVSNISLSSLAVVNKTWIRPWECLPQTETTVNE